MHVITAMGRVTIASIALTFAADAAAAQSAIEPTTTTTESTQTTADAVRPAPAQPFDRWTSYVGLGVQLLPEYDETGEGSGLSEQEFFALVTVDGRFGNDCSRPGAGRFATCLNPLDGPWHAGITLTLLGAPVKREDKPAISPTDFNDVARTAVASTYLYFPMAQSSDKVDNLGPFARAAAISRENLAANLDSVTWTYGLGFQYTSELFRTDGTENTFNGVPRGFVRLYAARYEDYAGFGRTTRLVSEAAFRISEQTDLYLGFQGNFGSGPDEMAVILSFVRTPDQIATLFSLGK